MSIVALVVILRLLNAILVTTQLDPDEWWQAPEVAHQLVFGCGVLTWEWEHGLRGYTHVLPFALGMQALKMLRFDSPLAIAMLPRLMQGVLAAVGDLLLRRLATRYFGSDEAGRCALLAFATSWFVAICGVRTYSSTAEATLLLAALCLLPLPGMSKAPSWWCHSLPPSGTQAPGSREALRPLRSQWQHAVLPVTCANVAHLAPANTPRLPGEPEPTLPRTRAHRAAAGALSAVALLVRPTAALLLVPTTALWLVLPSHAARHSHGDGGVDVDATPPLPSPSPPPLPSPSDRREAREARLSSRLVWLGGGAALEASVVRLEALASGSGGAGGGAGTGAGSGGGGGGGGCGAGGGSGLATANGAAPPLPCQPPEGWATCEDGGFVRVRGSDGGPVAAAAPPRGTPTASQLEQLEALVSRLETAAAGPPVRATLRRAWRRVLALTPCAVAGVAVTLAGFGIDRLCYGRCSLARAYCRPHPTAPPAPSVPSVPSASASASASASLPASPSPPPHLHPALT